MLKAFVKDSLSSPLGVWTLFCLAIPYYIYGDFGYYNIQTGIEGSHNWIIQVTGAPLRMILLN
jgi:hypothetical protein